MNRRSGEPTEVVVRFNPKEYGEAKVGTPMPTPNPNPNPGPKTRTLRHAHAYP